MQVEYFYFTTDISLNNAEQGGFFISLLKEKFL